MQIVSWKIRTKQMVADCCFLQSRNRRIACYQMETRLSYREFQLITKDIL